MSAPAATVTCRGQDIPPASALSMEAWHGRACFACGKPLTTVAIPVGRATGEQGVFDIGAPVFACS